MCSPYHNPESEVAPMLYTIGSLRREHGLDGMFLSYEVQDDVECALCVLEVLRRVAYIVGPIMQRRGWMIPVLGELPVSNTHELGVALVGDGEQAIRSDGVLSRARFKTIPSCSKIQLRIRAVQDRKWCLRIDDIVQTLLHELAHIARSPNHGLSFWWRNALLLKELERDVEMRVVDVKWKEVPLQVTFNGEVRGLKRLLLVITDR